MSDNQNLRDHQQLKYIPFDDDADTLGDADLPMPRPSDEQIEQGVATFRMLMRT
ncbi:hypothetical protein [Neorhizobium galegae]|uniref:hypothetical protein n=1 Tax=Neorhizobium galegae TaxID=399 RepID=UPI001783846E|nr:hypothetical protein [Neorhizobium galegae]